MGEWNVLDVFIDLCVFHHASQMFVICNLFLWQIVIELDGNNEKAWYRRGQACVRLKDFDKAKESFNKVAEVSGGKNKDVAKWLKQCDAELERSKKKEKQMYKEMFQSKKTED